MIRNALIMASFTTLVVGCSLFTTWEDVMGTWVGSDIKNIEDLWGPPLSRFSNEDGTTTYNYHREKVDPSCFHYWIVDQNGIITGFYYDGNCRPVG